MGQHSRADDHAGRVGQHPAGVADDGQRRDFLLTSSRIRGRVVRLIEGVARVAHRVVHPDMPVVDEHIAGLGIDDVDDRPVIHRGVRADVVLLADVR